MVNAGGWLKAVGCRREGDVEVAINPEELEGLDDTAVQALYRQRLEAQQQSQQREVRCLANFT